MCVLVSQGCCHKMPPTGSLTADIHSLTALRATVQNPGVRRAMLPPVAMGQSCHVSSRSWGLWVSLAYGCVTPVCASHASMRVSCKDTCRWITQEISSLDLSLHLL